MPLTLGPRPHKNVAQYPPHHVIYAVVKFEVATSNSLGQENTVFDLKVKVKGEIMYFLVNASPSKLLDVATSNFADALVR